MIQLRHNLSLEEFTELFDAGELSLETSSEFSVAPMSPPDVSPTSGEYHDWVLDVWSKITGRPMYEASRDESFDVPFEEFLARPYPHSSGSATEVGNYFGAIAWFLKEVDPRPGHRVVEYGSGWGHLALHLAMLGCTTTAVDLNPPSAELLRARAGRWGVALDVAERSFLDYEASEVDLIVFFEAFHHCAEPWHLLDRCREQLRPGGRIAFLADAIYDGFYCPWGVRLDGSATFMARHVGWLELGFDRRCFTNQLEARGFAVDSRAVDHLGAYGTLTTATLSD